MKKVVFTSALIIFVIFVLVVLLGISGVRAPHGLSPSFTPTVDQWIETVIVIDFGLYRSHRTALVDPNSTTANLEMNFI